MADVLVRAATTEDVLALANRLRPADLEEVIAYGVDDVHAAIAQSYRLSLHCWAGLVDDDLACVFGVTPVSMISGIGSPWMLGTPTLVKHGRVLVRETPRYIHAMLKAFPILQNHVHARNTVSVRWLRRLGFVLGPAEPFGPYGEPFHPFEMRA